MIDVDNKSVLTLQGRSFDVDRGHSHYQAYHHFFVSLPITILLILLLSSPISAVKSPGTQGITDFGGPSGLRLVRRKTLASTQQAYKLIVFVVDMCGKGGGPATTQEAVRSVLTSAAGSPNFSDYVSSCSKNVAEVESKTLKILNITMPCNGTSSITGMPWSVTSCQGSNVYGWFDYAEQQASEMGIDLALFTHRIMILPKNKQSFMENFCDWAGLGTQGVIQGRGPPFGYVWISGEHYTTLNAYMHEIGHTTGFKHAATPNCTYCDGSSAMGSTGSMASQCYNAPQSLSLGWLEEIQTLSLTSMAQGPTVYQIPGQHLSKKSVLTISDVSNSTVFVSFRINNGLYDQPFPNDNSPKVLIHTWDPAAATATTPGDKSSSSTVLQASLKAVGEFWTDTVSGLTLRATYMDVNGAMAMVSVCKPAGGMLNKEACFNSQASLLSEGSHLQGSPKRPPRPGRPDRPGRPGGR